MNAQDCMAGAEAALMGASQIVDAIAEQVTGSSDDVPVTEVMGLVQLQINLGQAWRDLAALKSFETER